MTGLPGSPRVLHVHGSMAAGNPLAERCARVIESFGGRMRHSIASGDGNWSALAAVSKGVPVERLATFPSLAGAPLPGRLQKLAQAMTDYHLVLSYGREGIAAALAHTLFSQVYKLPPLIHHEDGSDETARERRGWRSTWYRRIGLGKAAGLVVPTELMEGEALVRWQQPFGRVKTIRDGVPIDQRKGGPPAIPRLVKRAGEHWIGIAARFDGGEDLVAWLGALGDIDPSWHLVLVGDGPQRAAIEADARDRALANRVHIVTRFADPASLAAHCDIVGLAGGPEPTPRSALLAMAAGKPVAGFETGELAAALAEANAPFVAMPGDGAGLVAALRQLTDDALLRRRIGEANRERAASEHSEKAMIAAYRRLYASALGRETI